MAKKKEQTLEQIFESLEEVIGAMERPDVPLEESFSLYHAGMEMLKACNGRLDKVEKKMLALDSEGEAYDFEQ